MPQSPDSLFPTVPAQVFRVVASAFPDAFDPQYPEPLKIGVKADLEEIFPELASESIDEFLEFWCGRWAYIRALTNHPFRLNLDGTQATRVDYAHKKWAKRQIDGGSTAILLRAMRQLPAGPVSEVEDAFLRALMVFHPQHEKKALNMRGFVRAVNPEHKSATLCILKADGTVEPVSFRKCVANIHSLAKDSPEVIALHSAAKALDLAQG